MIENRLKKGLGRGLSSLLGDATKKIETNKVSIKDHKGSQGITVLAAHRIIHL